MRGATVTPAANNRLIGFSMSKLAAMRFSAVEGKFQLIIFEDEAESVCVGPNDFMDSSKFI